MPSSRGVLRYSSPGTPWRLVMEVDPGLSGLYRALVPKAVMMRHQRYGPHVTVVRDEVPSVPSAWGFREGREVQFDYSEEVRHDDVYWWLEVYCPRLTAVRLELGLPASSALTRPPDGRDCFHTTIGNCKT